MKKFIQLHALTIYPPSNPNRDDAGRPKSVVYGGVNRLRLSSQSVKRAIRTSDTFQNQFVGKLGVRTHRIGEVVLEALSDQDMSVEDKREIAKDITVIFGKYDSSLGKKYPERIRTKQLVYISPAEKQLSIDLALKVANGEQLPGIAELRRKVLKTSDGAVDIAMFGRMMADDPGYNWEAAVQVSHAFTTHKAVVEDDFYTAIDDINAGTTGNSAGFLGDSSFGSGLFYLYACIDTELLLANLSGDVELAEAGVSALIRAFASSAPSGKKASFAHYPRAGHVMLEAGAQQPRSLASAFFEPIQGGELLANSVQSMDDYCAWLDQAYGSCADERSSMSALSKTGSIDELIACATAEAVS